MESSLRFTIIILLVGFAPLIIASEPSGPAKSNISSVDANQANLPALPFVAEITSDDVYVRSGAGTNYYYCGKLRKGDKVTVVGTKFSWSQITPPAGSYSWISKQYIQADQQDPTNGTVIGDAVRVYAGSDDVQPMHSTSMQVKLNKGDKVTLLGVEKDGYCKIEPPEGAYLWVSTQYTSPLGSLAAPVQQSVPVPAAVIKPAQASDVNSPEGSFEDRQMQGVRAIEGLLEAERAKPIEEQNFTQMKKALTEVVANERSQRAARYAEKLLKVIERCELVQEVDKAVKLQEKQFEQTQQRIESAREAKLAQLEDISRFTAIGRFAESNVYSDTANARYYRLVDDEGKTICYAEPMGVASGLDLSMFVGKKVGLVGTIEPNHELGGAVVRFSEIAEVE